MYREKKIKIASLFTMAFLIMIYDFDS